MGGFRGDDRATEEARRLGAALARLRRDAGLNQAEAGARAGMTGQGWGLYESGRRPGLFRPDVQRRLTAALGADAETLALAAAGPAAASEPLATGVESRGAAFREAPAPVVAAPPLQMVLTDDGLDPWAGAGTVVEYDPGRFPRRGQGCVVEGNDGSVSVWLFDGADADRLHLRGGAGGLGSTIRLDRSLVAQVSAITARRDG
ncbi:MAG TPA: helix-turn-helix transcriptional regulator [Brevundimonas sp.]|jgi:transcriptional regulator with XRE-family HTH domain|uniref:helix-turn-helix domain-containing protein n=1 Tax=Brevundimonas sp. TaxID=1871086 RepID=UPI002DF02177|nr:helix-turn-helix transcriptional regulator [Brevundimonas sp.]